MPEMNQRTTHDELNQLIAWQVEQARNATVMAERYKLEMERMRVEHAQTLNRVAALCGFEGVEAMLKAADPKPFVGKAPGAVTFVEGATS